MGWNQMNWVGLLDHRACGKFTAKHSRNGLSNKQVGFIVNVRVALE